MKVEIPLEKLENEFRELASKYGKDVLETYKRILEQVYNIERRETLINSIVSFIFATFLTWFFATIINTFPELKLTVIMYVIIMIGILADLYIRITRLDTVRKHLLMLKWELYRK